MNLSIKALIPVIEKAFAMDESFLLPLKGVSMLPFFRTKDKAVIIKPECLRKRDCILYYRGDAIVFHRLLKIKKDHYLVAGDNETFYEKVKAEAIIAKMSGYIKEGSNYQSAHNFRYRFLSYIWSFMLLRKVARKLFKRLTR